MSEGFGKVGYQYKNVTRRELKKLISKHLRSDDTTARDFVNLTELYLKFTGHRSKADVPSARSEESEVNELVRKIEEKRMRAN